MPAAPKPYRKRLMKEYKQLRGYYHGRLLFPEGYPFKPPGIMMLTPSGRFQTGSRICMSMSDFHPDQWNPAWSVESILKGLLSFMLESTQTAGSIVTTEVEKRRLAQHSLKFNLADSTFCELFPEAVELIKKDLAARESGTYNADGTPGGSARSGAAGKDEPARVEAPLDTTTSNIILAITVVVFGYMVMSIIADAEENYP